MKNQKITFDFVVVDGRTGKEIGTSYGAAPAFAVLDKTQVSPGIVDGLIGASVGSRVLIAVAPKDGLAKGITGERRQEERHAAVPRRRQEHPHAARPARREIP